MSHSTWIFGGGIAVLAVLASVIASASPDGLERVATDLGFDHRATTVLEAPLPGYAVAALPPALSGAAAGLLGTLIAGGAAFVTGRILAVRR